MIPNRTKIVDTCMAVFTHYLTRLHVLMLYYDILNARVYDILNAWVNVDSKCMCLDISTFM